MPDWQGLMQAVGEPAVRNWIRSQGLVPGDFRGSRNLLDVLEDEQYQNELHEAMFGAAQADRPGNERLLGGITKMLGIEQTPELQQQLQRISGDVSHIAPYVQRWAPDLWDQLHGATGSTASLTHGIAEANRGRYGGMSPVEAQQQAQEVMQHLYGDNDPMKHRGYSAQEMGQMYQHLQRRGFVGPGMSPAGVAKEMMMYAAPLSAIRDSMADRGPLSVEQQWGLLDRMPDGLDPAEMEQQLRMGAQMGPGGAFGQSVRQHEPGSGGNGVSLYGAAQQDQQLRQQAANSPIGNMVAATVRLSNEVGFPPNSPAEQLLQQFQAGQVPITDVGQWTDILSRSGIAPEYATPALRPSMTNQQYMTPELIDTVRRAQYQVDLQPYAPQVGGNRKQQFQQRADLEQFAQSRGYQSAANMQQLHGPASQGVRGIMQQARGDAQQASQVSGVGQMSPVRRTVDTLRNATAATPGGEIVGRIMGGVKREEVPQSLHQQFPDVFGE